MMIERDLLNSVIAEFEKGESGEKRGLSPQKIRAIIEADIDEIINNYLAFLFPDYFCCHYNREQLGERLFSLLNRAVCISRVGDDNFTARDIFSRLPSIREMLCEDALATFNSDPAACSPEEVILAYPGFYATALHRLAHELYIGQVKYIPRLISESAHQKTGIDIHPGARIGRRFAIDHGTGIVIGESATIGDDVMIYHGVTLGAKSFELDGRGKPRKGGKRHPDIGNRCVIYSNATILGGETGIGDDCIIGCNVKVTSSIPKGQTVRSEK